MQRFYRSLPLTAACIAAFLTSSAMLEADAQLVLSGHVPHAIAASRPLNKLEDTKRLNIAIGLPLRNQNELDALLVELSDPASPKFRHYLSAAQFAAKFGPTEQQYQAVIEFAREHGLVVTGTHSNRMLLDVSGEVSDVERTFHVRIMAYQHPIRGRFYAPDREPTLDLDVPVLDISGLDDFSLPRPMGLHTMAMDAPHPYVTGSGPGGYFIGKDFRAAYAPSVSLTGSGQVVGLLEFDGFYAGDVPKNATAANVPAVATQTVLLDGFNGAPGSNNIEVILDIMMASYMAPGLSKVMVYEGTTPNDILNRMATDNVAQQLSSSWGFPINATTEQIFKQYIAQGQSLLQASGDSGAYKNGVMTPSDDPNLTVSGGTSLTTAGAGGPWQSEAAWSGSGGGVSTTYPIPTYQVGISMAANGGSTKMRNIPDVGLTAAIQMYLIQNNGQAVVVGGTSAAAPLWAGFIALANQQAAARGKQRVGFLNPLLYTIGKGSNYTADLNDVRSGSDGGFSAVSGYDLTTGWGSPAGQHLINDLTGTSSPPSFALASSSSALSIARGSTAAATLTVSGQNGFNGSVSFTVTGLPSGVTAVFSPASTTTATSLTFSASSTAAPGTYTATVTGASGALTSTTTIGLTVTAPNFTLSVLPATLALVRGSTATGTIAIAPQNGFNSNVTLTASGLPSGVTASFATLNTAGTGPVIFTASSAATAGSFSIVVKGVSGTLTSSTVFTLTVLVPTAGGSFVNLAPAYNVNAMVSDGLPFAGGGLDGGQNGTSTAYSANLIGVQQTIGGTPFYFGPANALDAVSAKTVPLPQGQFSSINLLATAVNGGQVSQVFKVTYTDGTASTYIQSVSDWFTPQNFAGETKAMTMAYRDNGLGQLDHRTFYLYEYKLPLIASKSVASITLPNNRNVVVLAASLARATASVR
jgi:subtilase family serine protease